MEKQRAEIEWFEQDIPVLFLCPHCLGQGMFMVNDYQSPTICNHCEGNGQIVIPPTTTNNPYVLQKYLSMVAPIQRTKP